ncbi:MAG TPA: SMC family ATPase [Gemmatimonadaceae bacterium]
MRLNSLHLTNFRQHVDTHIDFSTGITAIIGPNGSGKSTLLEAIAWALYGAPAARGKRESIRSYRAGPRAVVNVELEFELGAHRYRVSRGLTNAELYLDGASSPIATSISAVTDVLARRLGMNRDEFFHTYFTGQKELSVMAAMGPTERGQFLSRVLGYERLRAAQDLARERRKTLVAEATGLRAGMPDAEVVQGALADAKTRIAESTRKANDFGVRRSAARRAVEEIAPKWESTQRDRERSQALAAESRVADGELAAVEREIARIDRELGDAATARAELDGVARELVPLPSLEAELKELDRSAAEAGRKRTLTETEATLAKEIAQLRERASKIEVTPALETEVAASLKQSRESLDETQRALEAAQTDWVRDKQEAETKRQALIERLKDVRAQRDQIVELGEGGICPICARPLGTHFRSVLDVLDNQIETITVDGKYFRARIDQLVAVPPEITTLADRRRELMDAASKLERRVAEIQAGVRALSTIQTDLVAKDERHTMVANELAGLAVNYDAARHADVRALVDRLAPLAVRATKLAAQLEREPVLVEERTTVRAKLEEIQLRRADVARQTQTLGFSEDAFNALRGRFDSAEAELRSAELAAVGAETEFAAAKNALTTAEQARAELARAEERLAVLGRDRRLHEELDRAFSDLRTELNVAMRPEISELASRYIRELTDGRYTEFELDDDYQIVLLEGGIPQPVISGGEEDLANLVLRLAISEMIAERAGQPFSLLVLDEVFGSLDEVRRQNVVGLLQRLPDRFEQIILITHIEAMREAPFDRMLTVTYDDEAEMSRVDTGPARGVEPMLELHAGAAD